MTATACFAEALIMAAAMGMRGSCSLSRTSSLLLTRRDAVASITISTSASQSSLDRVWEMMFSTLVVTVTPGAMDCTRRASTAALGSFVSAVEKFWRTMMPGITRDLS